LDLTEKEPSLMAVTTAEKPRSRSKLTKALVATGVGVALLAGGGGTFAAWSSTQTVKPGTVTAGELALSAPTDGGTWSSASTGKIDSIAAYRIVPGEVLTYTQNVGVTATGSALTYELGTNLTSPEVVTDNELAAALDQSAVISVNGKPVTEPLEATEGVTSVQVTVTITFPFSSGNETQKDSVNLKNVQVIATQTAPINAASAGPIG